MRLTSSYLFPAILIVIILALQWYTEGIEVLGLYLGIPAGVLLTIPLLVSLLCSAKKGEFNLKVQRAWTFWPAFFGLTLISGVAGAFIVIKIERDFPNIDISRFVRSILLVGSAVFLAISLIGIYWLEYHYGNKFLMPTRQN